MKKLLLILICLLLLPQSAFSSTKSDGDKLFDWAENQLPQYFSPTASSQLSDNWYYRYYPEKNTAMAVKTDSKDIYVLGDDFGGLVRVDTLAALMVVTGLSGETGLGSLAITGSNSDILNEHSFSPESFQTLENGDMQWNVNKDVSENKDLWSIIIGIIPGSSPKQAYSVTFNNGWTTEQIMDYVNIMAPVNGVTINDTSITFTNVTGSDRLTLNGTLVFQ